MVQDKIIFGIDISKGSPRGKEKPSYAVAIHSNGRVEHHRMISLHKLMRMIWEQKPHILAVDNIHELARDRRDLISFMGKLPHQTRLVQVTGGEHLKPLTGLARSRGISFNRFDPIQEADVCAQLALVGVGDIVSVFEDKTFIKVSRARSLGRGGWSQNRYRRKVHGHVRQKTREIEDTLRELKQEKGINYSSKNVKGFGGYTRGEFVVDAPHTEIPLSSLKLGDVQVKVQPVERDAINFTPLKDQKRKIVIAGIDPGTTTGLALLDLDGTLIKLQSSREMSVSDVIEIVALYGRPLIVATDVRPIPGTVEKIRRSFNAISGEPDTSLATEEKIELAKPYGYKNDHERDALAAAAHTFRKFKNKFDQIRKKVPPGIDVDEAIALVMKGDSIDSAIARLTGRKVMPEVQPDQETGLEPDEKFIEATETIKRQQETIDSLRSYLEELKSEIKDQAHQISNQEKKIQDLKAKTYSKLRKAKEMRIRDEKIRMLEKAIKAKDLECIELSGLADELKRVRTLETSGRIIPVKVIPAFTKEALAIVNGQYGLKPGDVLFFKDASGGGPATVDILADAGIRAVVFRGEMAHIAIDEFYKKGLPFINIRSVHVHYVDDFGVVDPEELETCEARFREELTSRRIKEKEQWLDSLLEEYKSERRRA